MSGIFPQQFWKLNNYSYPFYRFIIENNCLKLPSEKPLLILDAGCGANTCSLSKVPKNITVIGIDLSKENIYSSHQKAKEKGYKNFHFIVGSIISIPFKTNIYDISVCVDVLEHLPNKHRAIAEISQVCKTGATFIGSTSNSLNPVLFFDSFAPRSIVKVLTKKFAPYHYERHGRLNPKKLIQTLQCFGFNVQIKLLGFPQFQPWLYQYSKKKIPFYAYLWILFDKITNKKPLNFLKEVIVFHAIKNSHRQERV